jgi:hypothetical protein
MAFCLKVNVNGEVAHVLPTVTIAADGRSYEIHHVRLEDGRTDAVLKVRLDTDPTILTAPNVNTAETELLTVDTHLTVEEW